jgi:hypothetical protein
LLNVNLRPWSFVPGLSGLSTSVPGFYESCWKAKDTGDELEDSIDCDAQKAEWKEQEPDDRVKQQCQQRKRPTKDQKNAPQKEFQHICAPFGDNPLAINRPGKPVGTTARKIKTKIRRHTSVPVFDW